MKTTVAVIQMSCVLGNVEANLEKAQKLAENAVRSGAEWIVFPELFNTGYCIAPYDRELAETIPGGKTCTLMQELSARYQVLLTGCLVEQSPMPGVLYDTAISVFPHGGIETYRKVHLWGDECLRWKRGTDYGRPYSWKDWTIGMQICYEAGIPEGARFAALQGANALVYCAAFGEKRRYAWELGTRARALENGCYVIACNRFGKDSEQTVFAAHSRIVAPDGSVLTEALSEDAVLFGEIDTEQVITQRQTIPYLRDLNTAALKNFWAGYSENQKVSERKLT